MQNIHLIDAMSDLKREDVIITAKIQGIRNLFHIIQRCRYVSQFLIPTYRTYVYIPKLHLSSLHLTPPLPPRKCHPRSRSLNADEMQICTLNPSICLNLHHQCLPPLSPESSTSFQTPYCPSAPWPRLGSRRRGRGWERLRRRLQSTRRLVSR